MNHDRSSSTSEIQTRKGSITRWEDLESRSKDASKIHYLIDLPWRDIMRFFGGVDIQAAVLTKYLDS